MHIFFKLCAYVVRTVPTHWPDAIPQLMETFRNSLSQSTINVSVMILEILMALPEEVSFLKIKCNFKLILKHRYFYLVWCNNINSNTTK